MNIFKLSAMAMALSCAANSANAQITLIGDNTPYTTIADGDFKEVWAAWRSGTKPPFWDMYNKRVSDKAFPTDPTMGLDYGRMYGANDHTIFRSGVLDQNPLYQTPKVGDRLKWELGADVEYRSSGTVSLSLLFGEKRRVLAENIKLKGSDGVVEYFSGYYTLTKEDAAQGLPSLEITMKAEDAIKVYVDYVNIYLESDELRQPTLNGHEADGAIQLEWSGKGDKYYIYRADSNPNDPRYRANYKLIAESEECRYSDSDIISGRTYYYAVTNSLDGRRGSNIVALSAKDAIAPSAPKGVAIKNKDASIVVSWSKNNENDIAYYSVERGKRVICANTKALNFEDILALKGVENQYRVYAHDFSGNRSKPSKIVIGETNLVAGASFSDLIKPIPIIGGLSSDVWGATAVTPRDTLNGIESPDWSYWGGRPVEDHDGKFHMAVTRWPESALKGHWEWPRSTVTHVVADNPVGPYKVVRETAYDFHDGMGHNPDVILLNDGTYALYSLINWEPTIFTSPSMSGPWKRLGVLTFDKSEAAEKFASIRDENIDYHYQRNLSGVELEDGRILMVTKFGSMMVSENGLLGPYIVKSERIAYNKTLPDEYNHFGYEDPVMWRDSVQFHMIINAFIVKRAIYLRSGDGINWVYDQGMAYNNELTNHSDGTPNYWDKLERPHILQDSYGRATHLSLAAIDVDKALDYGGDNHNSKNLILPLQKHRLISLERASKNEFCVVVKAEKGFNPVNDIDLATLRFGAASYVDYGKGCRVYKVENLKSGDLKIYFRGESGITESDFALKLLGREYDGDIVISFCKPL